MLEALLAMTLAAAVEPPGTGIPESLARDRAAAISDLRYDLTFTVPANRTTPVHGRAVLRFVLKTPRLVVLDFAQPAERLLGVRNGRGAVGASVQNGHVIVPAEATQAGQNEITIDFTAGDEALNRNDEFLYTLFVPARARLTFPCFDQPDLKARYTLTLDVPTDWQAVANGARSNVRIPSRREAAFGSPRRSRCRPTCSRSSPGSSWSRPRSAAAGN